MWRTGDFYILAGQPEIESLGSSSKQFRGNKPKPRGSPGFKPTESQPQKECHKVASPPVVYSHPWVIDHVRLSYHSNPSLDVYKLNRLR